MCYHRRILCVCNHAVWLARAALCDEEKAYAAGATGEPCTLRKPHPLATVRIERECDACALARERTGCALSAARRSLGSIRETLERVAGGSQSASSAGESKEEEEDERSTPGRRDSGQQQMGEGPVIETVFDAKTLIGGLEKERLQKLLEKKERESAGKPGSMDAEEVESEETMEMIKTGGHWGQTSRIWSGVVSARSSIDGEMREMLKQAFLENRGLDVSCLESCLDQSSRFSLYEPRVLLGERQFMLVPVTPRHMR